MWIFYNNFKKRGYKKNKARKAEKSKNMIFHGIIPFLAIRSKIKGCQKKSIDFSPYFFVFFRFSIYSLKCSRSGFFERIANRNL